MSNRSLARKNRNRFSALQLKAKKISFRKPIHKELSNIWRTGISTATTMQERDNVALYPTQDEINTSLDTVLKRRETLISGGKGKEKW